MVNELNYTQQIQNCTYRTSYGVHIVWSDNYHTNTFKYRHYTRKNSTFFFFEVRKNSMKQHNEHWTSNIINEKKKKKLLLWPGRGKSYGGKRLIENKYCSTNIYFDRNWQFKRFCVFFFDNFSLNKFKSNDVATVSGHGKIFIHWKLNIILSFPFKFLNFSLAKQQQNKTNNENIQQNRRRIRNIFYFFVSNRSHLEYTFSCFSRVNIFFLYFSIVPL